MNHDDLTDDLAQQLRRQGVTFRRADLDAFAAELPAETVGAGDLDLERLAKRFSEASRAHLLDARQAEFSPLIMAFGMVLAMFGLVMLVLFIPPALMSNEGPPVIPALIFCVGFIGGGLGLTAYAAMPMLRLRKARRPRRGTND